MIGGARRLLLAGMSAGAVLVALPASADSKPLDLADFVGLDLSSGIKAIVTPGDAFSVTAQSSRSGDIEDLKASVVAGVLRASYDWSIFHILDFSGRDMTLTITMPELDSVAVSGGAALIANSAASDDLKLDASGGSTVRMVGASAKRYTIAASGGATVMVSGTCYNASINASGGATVTLRDLICADVTVNGSGGAHINGWATASASGVATGGSDVAIYGHPALTQIDASGGGRIDYPN